MRPLWRDPRLRLLPGWCHDALDAIAICACFPAGAMRPLWRDRHLRLLPGWRHEALGLRALP